MVANVTSTCSLILIIIIDLEGFLSFMYIHVNNAHYIVHTLK